MFRRVEHICRDCGLRFSYLRMKWWVFGKRTPCPSCGRKAPDV